MRFLRTLLIVIAGCSALFAQQAPRQGVYTSDINRKVEPCDDFYEYANGAWRAGHPMPGSMSMWSRRWASGELSKDQLKEILDDISKRHDWPKGGIEQQVGDFYGACMNEARVNQLGRSPAQPLLNGIDAIKTSGDLQKLITRLSEVGIGAPFSLFASSDRHNPGEMIAEIGANGISLPDRDYYLKPDQRFQETREKFRAHITRMFKLAGYGDDAATAAAETVFRMEKGLAEAALDRVLLRNPQSTDHKMTFDALQKLTPAFDWASFFKAAGIPRNDLNVGQPKLLQEADRQLRETPLADWKIYLKWRLLNASAPVLSAAFVEENFDFHERHLSGAREMKPRWKRCVELTDGGLGEALGKKYVEKYFPPEAKARAQEMVKNILAAMHDTIEGLGWMGPETRKKALEKLSTFNPKIGYPDKWIDYSKVEVQPDTLWENASAARRFNVAYNRSFVGKPTDRGRWGMTPPTSNAYYNPLLNEIVFPAGILQPPAFNTQAVDAINYGAIGVVIGHEISHGFDDQGAKFDATGNLHNWWTESDLKNFETRTACVARQFDGYFIEPNIHHNGRLVLGESIGDLAGAKIAYLAFKKSLQGKPPAPTIDGFTPEQQFFIAWGQFRGDAIRPETQRLMVQSVPHPIGKYRVIGPLSNMPEFQKAFGCKAGSTMVRAKEDRCEVW